MTIWVWVNIWCLNCPIMSMLSFMKSCKVYVLWLPCRTTCTLAATRMSWTHPGSVNIRQFIQAPNVSPCTSVSNVNVASMPNANRPILAFECNVSQPFKPKGRDKSQVINAWVWVWCLNCLLSLLVRTKTPCSQFWVANLEPENPGPRTGIWTCMGLRLQGRIPNKRRQWRNLKCKTI